MSPENFRAERVDYYILPGRTPDATIISPQNGEITIEGIGIVRIIQEINGHLTGGARFFKGVKVKLPNQPQFKIDPLPHVPFKGVPISLDPGESMTFEKKRFVRGKTVVTVTNTTT